MSKTSDLVAYELRSEYAGTVTVELEDGSSEDRPKFGGGVLQVGDGDFHVADTLAEGDGVIVIHQSDDRLRDLLDHYPALKHTTVPDGAEPVSRYQRQPTADLRHVGDLRDIKGAKSMSRDDLVASLEAYDRAAAEGDLVAIEAVQLAGKDHSEVQLADDEQPSPEPEESTLPPVDSLSNTQLAAVIDGSDDETLRQLEVPAALDELRRRANELDDQDAEAILVERNIENEGGR